MRNSLTIDDIGNMPAADLMKLSAGEFAMLFDEADAMKAKAENAKAFLQTVIGEKYKDQITALYADKGETTGVVRVADGDYELVVNHPKRVDWDNDKLAAIAQRIVVEWNDNPDDYIQVSRKVEEKKFNAWPPMLQQTFAGARTVKTGKPTFKFEQKEVEG